MSKKVGTNGERFRQPKVPRKYNENQKVPTTKVKRRSDEGQKNVTRMSKEGPGNRRGPEENQNKAIREGSKRSGNKFPVVGELSRSSVGITLTFF